VVAFPDAPWTLKRKDAKAYTRALHASEDTGISSLSLSWDGDGMWGRGKGRGKKRE